MISFTVEPLSETYLAQVASLEKIVFPAEPWSEASLRLLCGDTGWGVVILQGGQAVGYGGMTYAAGEGSVTDIAVHPDFRRQGIGRAVTTALLQQAGNLGLCSLWLEVRPSNTAAISLYTGLGFAEVGRRKHFYRAPTEDALLFCATLGKDNTV